MMPPVLFICGRFRWRRAAFHVRGVFYYDTALLPFVRAVLLCLFVYPIRGTGRGLVVCPRPVVYLLVAFVDGICDGDGVSVDSV